MPAGLLPEKCHVVRTEQAPLGANAMQSQGELEATICDIVTRFQQEYMGRGPRRVHTHLVDNKLFVHLDGVLTAAEQRLIESHHNGNGRAAELLKQLRSHLVLAGRQTLEAMVREATGSPFRFIIEWR